MTRWGHLLADDGAASRRLRGAEPARRSIDLAADRAPACQKRGLSMKMLITAAVLACLLTAARADVGPTDGRGGRTASQSQAPPLALVTIGYYVNGRPRDPSACQLVFFHSEGRAEPRVAAGAMYWYVRPSLPAIGQRIVLKCDTYIAASPAGYDLFSGGISIVLSVYSPPGRVAIDAPDADRPDVGDYRLGTRTAYDNGRFVLRQEWETLPEAFRKTIKSSHVMVVTDSGDTFAFATGYR
jgi:hypothetical protein